MVQLKIAFDFLNMLMNNNNKKHPGRKKALLFPWYFTLSPRNCSMGFDWCWNLVIAAWKFTPTLRKPSSGQEKMLSVDWQAAMS